jgi:insulysin
VKTFRNKMLENFRFTTFFSGNILRDEAINLIDVIQDIFHETTNHIQVDNHLTRVANIHGQSIAMPIISRSANEADPNGVTLNYYQIGHRDQKQYTIMNLLQSTFQNKAYGYLRTELQLGYVVAA